MINTAAKDESEHSSPSPGEHWKKKKINVAMKA